MSDDRMRTTRAQERVADLQRVGDSLRDASRNLESVRDRDDAALICDNEECELFDQTQDGEQSPDPVMGVMNLRCEECGRLMA